MSHATPDAIVAKDLTTSDRFGAQAAQVKARVLLYSDDATTRAAVRRAIGRRAAADSPFIQWQEVATSAAMFEALSAGGLDLVVLDGETAKVGGFGLSREIKDSFFDAPPVLLLVARPQDAWLASWSQADGVVPFPAQPAELAATVAALLRTSAS